MILSLLLFACADEVRDIEVIGSGGAPEVYWKGASAENISFTRVDGAPIWNLVPEGELCQNALSGRAGVLWGELPEGFVSVDYEGASLEPADSLEDGSYSVGVGVCDTTTSTGASYFNRGASFTITDGEVMQLVVE